ncbi:MAG TPA: hypothetical protein PK110_12400, partial [Niabella sp.]|nr:hypothetical protein [Niabella sp.]
VGVVPLVLVVAICIMCIVFCGVAAVCIVVVHFVRMPCGLTAPAQRHQCHTTKGAFAWFIFQHLRVHRTSVFLHKILFTATFSVNENAFEKIDNGFPHRLFVF